MYKQLADLYRDGYWKRYSYGTLNLQHIRKNDIIEALDNMEDKKDYKDETSDKFQDLYNNWLNQSKNIGMLLEGHSSELVREGREIRRFIKKLEDMR